MDQLADVCKVSPESAVHMFRLRNQPAGGPEDTAPWAGILNRLEGIRNDLEPEKIHEREQEKERTRNMNLRATDFIERVGEEIGMEETINAQEFLDALNEHRGIAVDIAAESEFDAEEIFTAAKQ